jgi:hypothetical protein
MIKFAMHLAKDDLKCDALFVQFQADHDKELLMTEHKFRLDKTPINYYAVNWFFGDNVIEPKDNAIFWL